MLIDLNKILACTVMIVFLFTNTSCTMWNERTDDQGSTEIPVVSLQNVGPAGFDLPGKTVEIKVSSKDGASYAKDRVSIVVPSGALVKDGIIKITEFTNPPPLYKPSRGERPLPTVPSISKVYDLGPDGTSFSKPVKVTIPYEKSLVSPADKSKISLLYYNGRHWIPVGGLVDTDRGTVSAYMTAFPGSVILVTLLGVVIATAYGIAGYKSYQHYKGDPISNNNAKDYVTPSSTAVADYTKRAGTLVKIDGKPTWIPLEDPKKPGTINPEYIKYVVELAGSNTNAITFDGNDRSGGTKPSYTKDYNWVKPDSYFSTGMKGDCTCITAAYLSMLRRLGIEAYGVDGDKTNVEGTERHCWVEFYIDGKAYFYDADEGIMPLEKVGGLRNREHMWNEKGQKSYESNWWHKLKTMEQPKAAPPKKATRKFAPGNTRVDYIKMHMLNQQIRDRNRVSK